MLNPIKTPQEMLLEETGLPHYGLGGSVLSAGAQQLVQKAIKQYKQINGKLPSPQEIAQLEQEATKLSQPTSSMAGANVARMQKQEPYAQSFVDQQGTVNAPYSLAPRTTEGNRYSLFPKSDNGGVLGKPTFDKAFDPRDNFLTSQINQDPTKQLRTNKSTNMVPDFKNIDDIQGQARASVGSPNQPLEALDQGPGPSAFRSTEPSYDPHDYSADELDMPVSSMTLRGDVTPGASALNQMAAASKYPHDYTGQGDSAIVELDAFNRQLKAGTLTKQLREERDRLRQNAIDSGIAPSAVEMSPSKLRKSNFKSLLEEIEMGPAGPETSMGGYAHGGSVHDMRHMMIALGHEPQYFAQGGRPSITELYNQIPQRQADYKTEQGNIAQGAADYYNQPSDPYFQDIINKAGSNNFHQMMDQQNPAPTFQAQPVTPTSWTRDQFAKVIGDTPADRLFGTGSEGQKAEYKPLQFFNPVSQVTDTMGMVPEVAHQLHEGNVGTAGALAGITALGAAPFAKPIKHIIKKIRH